MNDKVCRPGKMWSLGLLLLTGCKLLLSAPTPLRALSYPAAPGAQAPTVFLFLPGRGDDAEAFAEHGFFAKDEGVDFIAVNATLGYYVHETLHQRVREDVLPTVQSYSHRWIGGISMGGMGALLVHKDDPSFEGILLIAPYLGDEPVIEEIEKAGGLAKWKPPDQPADYQRELWRYLQTLTSTPGKGPEIYLAYGKHDRLVRGHGLLAAVLPPDHVLTVQGGHDWEPWVQLWEHFLTRWKAGR
ncbi:MAG: alpha/beta hydrolase-fold protein [Myxococcaceae bacterium]